MLVLSLSAGWQVTGAGPAWQSPPRSVGGTSDTFPSCALTSPLVRTLQVCLTSAVSRDIWTCLHCVGGYMYLQAVSGAEQSVQFLLAFISITPHFTQPQPAGDNNSQIQHFLQLTRFYVHVQTAQEIFRKLFKTRCYVYKSL